MRPKAAFVILVITLAGELPGAVGGDLQTPARIIRRPTASDQFPTNQNRARLSGHQQRHAQRSADVALEDKNDNE